jgi:cytochrome c peroxidase
LLRTRGLIRIALAVPSGADYAVTAVSNPYACNETEVISQYRRPLPATNLQFLSTVMWDGRESSPLTGTTKILFVNYPASLQGDLAHQSLDATVDHAQGDGTRPTLAEQQQIVNFEMALFTAQSFGFFTGPLNAAGGNGGPMPLATLPFFVSINSSVHALLPPGGPEQPGGLMTPSDGQFTSNIFNLYNAWSGGPSYDFRASVARGQAIFNTRPITITGVAGINDDVSEGGLVSGGIPSLTGTCGTCHDTPNVGNHSFPTPLNIGTGDPSSSNAAVNMGGLDISYLPQITVCQLVNGQSSGNCKTSSDLGQGLIDGKFAHVGKIKGPILRGLSARAPYFHNGSAQTLLDVVHFYENRFGVVLSPNDELDLLNFLSVL